MNYSNPVLIETLAQRYVLGIMSYRARRRFSQILEQYPEARESVIAWEERLQPLLISLDPVKPSELVWQRISKELNQQPVIKQQNSASLMGGFKAAAIAMLTITLGVTSLGWWQASNQIPETIIETVEIVRPEPAAVAVLGNAESSFWVARIYHQSARLDLSTQGTVEIKADKDYELWAIQDDGTPVSLGLLPKTGKISIALNATALAAISRSELLAVSLEPLGGSPQPVPTGPVLFSGELFLAQG